MDIIEKIKNEKSKTTTSRTIPMMGNGLWLGT